MNEIDAAEGHNGGWGTLIPIVLDLDYFLKNFCVCTFPENSQTFFHTISYSFPAMWIREKGNIFHKKFSIAEGDCFITE